MTTRTSNRQSVINDNRRLTKKFVDESYVQINKINRCKRQFPDKIKYFTKLYEMALEYFHVVEKDDGQKHERMSNTYYQKAIQLCSDQIVADTIHSPYTIKLVKTTNEYQRIFERHLKQKYETALLERRFGRDVANIILQFVGVNFDSTITLFTHA